MAVITLLFQVFFASRRSFLRGLVCACFCTAQLLLACFAHASPVTVVGLAGVESTVAWRVDLQGQDGVDELALRTDFKPLLDMIGESNDWSPVWVRIDLSVPAALVGQTAWLQVQPAYLHDVRLYQTGVPEQRSGMGLAFSQHSQAMITPTFAVVLNQVSTRVYLRLVGNSLRVAQFNLLSNQALQEDHQRDGQVHGFFFGAMLLMLLVNLMNWAWTRDPIYRSYVGFLASGGGFFLFSNGYMSAYVFNENPELAQQLAKLCVSWAVASGIFFTLRIMEIDRRQPRLALALRWLGWLLLVSNLLVSYLPWVPILMRANAISHLLSGLLLLAMCAQQAWQIRSMRTMVLFASFLVFTVCDKAPILALMGLFPLTDWLLDIRKVGYMVQFLVMHLLLVAQFRAQQRQKSESVALVQAASKEAQAAHFQRTELNRFLGLLGHEIRTPLAVIDSAVQSLELQPGADEPDRHKRHARIRHAVKRLDRLVGDAMQRERVESAGWKLQRTRWATHDLVNAALHPYELELPPAPLSGSLTLPLAVGGAPGGALTLSAPSDELRIEGDLPLLQIALSNLLDNACKYADPGSTVRLDIGRIESSAPDAPATFRLDVVSRGPVLSPTELARVFEKYWRHDQHHGVGGAGLGLHLVRHIMQLHGGSAEVWSLPGRWTCFSLQFPLVRK